MKAKDRLQKQARRWAGEQGGAQLEKVVREEASGTSQDWSASGTLARRWLVAILASACLLRLAHFWAIADTAFLRIPLSAAGSQSDQYAFWQWAQAILSGDLLGRNTYHPYFEWMKSMAPMETWHRWWGGKEIFQQAPLYPYWVAGLAVVSNNSVGFVIFVQLIAGALHPLVIFRLAERVFDARVGLVAAALTAFYGPFILHQGVLLRDWLPPLMEPLALVVLLGARASGRPVHWLLAGAALGVAVLAKESMLLFMPMVMLWLLVEYRGAWKRAAMSGAVLVLGLVLALSPLFFRNYMVGAPLFAISNRSAEGFIVGNAADAFPVGATVPASMKDILARSDGRVPALIRHTLGTYQGDWLKFVALQLFKLRALVDPLEVPNNVGLSYGLEISPALWFTLRYGIIFPIGIAGFFLSLRSWRRHLLLALYALSTVGGLIAATILARYRLVLVPPLMIYGATGLVSLVDAIRTKQRGMAKVYLGLVLILAVIQHVVLPFPGMREAPDYVIHSYDYFNAAEIYAADSRPDQAVTEMERLQERAGQHPGFAAVGAEARLREGNYRVQWAKRLIVEGRREEATRQAGAAQAAYRPLGLSDPQLALGHLYLDLEDPATARRLLQRFLELEPEGSRADEVRRTLDRLPRDSE
jgi:4-amino-4-deoxy-L-arabinose transferase-like glycosyltransferase